MYTKEQASAVRQRFWISFGKYMQPVPSASEEKVNWINYKTGIKGIFFKMDVDNDKASISIEISPKETALQYQYFNLFQNLQKQFQDATKNNWIFTKYFEDEFGKSYSTISLELMNVNIFRETDWPQIISFLKLHIIALDIFWNEYKVAFEMM